MNSTLISTSDLASRLDDPALVLLDVRHDLAQPETWGEAQYRTGHIPGAQFVHLDRDLSAPKTGKNGRHPLPSPEACAALFGRLGIDADKQVVAYDSGGGMYAPHAWWMLRWLGHDAVAVLDGGFGKWVREHRPVTTEIPAARPATFTVRRVGPFLSANDVLASLEGRRCTLVDARGAERYRGEVEPLDPVAGHIPGAVNRPYTRERRGRRNVQVAGDAARRAHRRDRECAAGDDRQLLRIGRERVPQPARDGDRRDRRDEALPRLVERVVRRSRASGGARSRVDGQASLPAVRPSSGQREMSR